MISRTKVKGYDRITLEQFPAARMVQAGEVDCCVSTQTAARALGLDLMPLTQNPYHFVIRRTYLNLRLSKC
jgi:putative molybdopterin biosynthesis protein